MSSRRRNKKILYASAVIVLVVTLLAVLVYFGFYQQTFLDATYNYEQNLTGDLNPVAKSTREFGETQATQFVFWENLVYSEDNAIETHLRGYHTRGDNPTQVGEGETVVVTNNLGFNMSNSEILSFYYDAFASSSDIIGAGGVAEVYLVSENRQEPLIQYSNLFHGTPSISESGFARVFSDTFGNVYVEYNSNTEFLDIPADEIYELAVYTYANGHQLSHRARMRVESIMIGIPQPELEQYFRFQNNTCSQVMIQPQNKLTNDYVLLQSCLDLIEYEEPESNETQQNGDETENQTISDETVSDTTSDVTSDETKDSEPLDNTSTDFTIWVLTGFSVLIIIVLLIIMWRMK